MGEPKLKINFCEEEDLLTLPGVGRKVARTIWLLRERESNITPGSLSTLSRLRNVNRLIKLVDFERNPKNSEDVAITEDQIIHSKTGG